MSRHEFFFVRCGNTGCSSRMILPCNRGGWLSADTQLGRNMERDKDIIPVSNRLRGVGAHEYDGYQRAPDKWQPLRFACFKCGFCSEHERPEFERVEDVESSKRLSEEIGANSIWPIEVKDDPDPHYEDRKILYYTVAANERNLVDFIIEGIKPVLRYADDGIAVPIRRENVRVLTPIKYHREFDFPSSQ